MTMPLPPATGLAGGLLRRVLEMPLLQKLLLADLLINLTAFFIMGMAPRSDHGMHIMFAALVLTVALNGALVYWSLLPLQTLQATAGRVARGDLHARVPTAPVADRQLSRIGRTFNALLDRLLADQARLQYLSAQAIGAADAERAHFARELHDSTAQSLSAVEMLLSATCEELATSQGSTQRLQERLQTMRDTVGSALQEVRSLSHRAHPSALEHLGLAGALQALVARTLTQSGIAHNLRVREDAPVTPLVASVLYRVAQEALANAMRHGRPTHVSLRLDVDRRTAWLTVQDDGQGFDPHVAERTRRGMGLFLMRERLMLVNGELAVSSRPGEGTAVHAIAPNEAQAAHTKAPDASPDHEAFA